MSPATRDAALTIGLVISFALFVTIHVANVFGVFKRRGALPGLGAMIAPPLAPYLAARSGMVARACLWLAAAAAYAVAFLGARR